MLVTVLHIPVFNLYCVYVRPYFRPQKVCPISMKFGVYIEVDE